MVKGILQESEFRCLPSKLWRAACLVHMGYCPPRIAAEATGLPETTVKRGVRALQESRVPGKVGQPTSLTTSLEAELVKWVTERPAGMAAPSTEDVISEVRSSPQCACDVSGPSP